MFNNKKAVMLTAAATTLLSGAAFAEVTANVSIQNADKLKNSKDVVATVSFTNTDAKPAKMLSYLMKANSNGELEEHLFKVTRDGIEVEYEGMHAKRPAPSAGDYVKIAPGQTVSFDIELSGAYDLTKPGNYTIQYQAHGFNMFSEKPNLEYKAAIEGIDGIKSNKAAVFIAKDAAYDFSRVTKKGKPCNPKKEDCGGGGGGSSDIVFTGGCTSGEQADLISALAAAKVMANDSVAYLNGSVGSRYTTWFGTYNSQRFNTVASNFDAIKSAMDNEQMTFDCGCNQSYFAYVYPNRPYEVFFCRAFWNANETGTDSRAGTIIHEISHFNAVAGTDDVVYGQSGAQSLAISDPNSAVQNADSHEYFAENTPNRN